MRLRAAPQRGPLPSPPRLAAYDQDKRLSTTTFYSITRCSSAFLRDLTADVCIILCDRELESIVKATRLYDGGGDGDEEDDADLAGCAHGS